MPISLTGSLNLSGSNTLIGTKTITGSVFISGSKTIIGTTSITGSLLVTGSLNTVGTITATTLVVQTITSSISSITGSTNFGSLSSDTHKFTGSLNVTGAFYVTTGSVGIGTVSPSQKLEVVGGEIKAGRVDTNQEGGQVSFGRASDNNTSWYIDLYGNASSPQLRFVDVDNSAVRMTLTGSNVGIGTSSPANYFTTTLTIDGSSSQGIMFRASGTDKGYVYQDGSFIQVGSNTGGVIFKSADTERMRITSGGDININMPNSTNRYISWYSANGAYQVAGISSITNASYNDSGYLNFSTARTSSGGFTMKMTINPNGNIGVTTDGTQIYNPSDARLKRNIETITYGLDKVLALNPVKYNWIEGFSESEKDKVLLGFIAQEVEKVIPEAVEDFSDGNTLKFENTVIENPLRVSEKFIIPVLVKAIQELTARVQYLENK
jgi:hypothetical protein